MASFDYSEVTEAADTALAFFGRQVTIIELGDVASDPAQPWLGTTTTRSAPKQTVTVFGCFVEPESMERLGEDIRTDDWVKRSQKICITRSAVDLKPFNEVLDDDGSRWRIEGMSHLKPGPVSVLYFIGLSR